MRANRNVPSARTTVIRAVASLRGDVVKGDTTERAASTIKMTATRTANISSTKRVKNFMSMRMPDQRPTQA
ncbi:Uncharacterised protein [Mycobacteroides abscessus subsp. massiliense]|nr:Uncharacterised protein [Mycobacteroides abscessus subsp. massiliense]